MILLYEEYKYIVYVEWESKNCARGLDISPYIVDFVWVSHNTVAMLSARCCLNPKKYLSMDSVICDVESEVEGTVEDQAYNKTWYNEMTELQ